MQTRNFWVVIVAMVLFSMGTQLLAQTGADESVTLKSFVGKVEVRPPSSVAFRLARIGMSLKSGWAIRTYVESEAEIAFATGTIIKIGENSVVELNKAFFNAKANASATSVKVATGQVWANVKKLTNQTSKFEFETPTATASIRGTRLGINVGKDGTAIDVYEGLVMVRPKGSDKDIPVSTKNRAIVTPGSSTVDVKGFEGAQKADSTKTPGSLAAPVDPFAPAEVAQTAVDSSKLTAGSDSSSSQIVADTTGKKTPADSTKPIVAKPDTTTLATTSAKTQQSATDSTAATPAKVPLVLDVTSPQAAAILKDPTVTVKGKATKGSIVSVNGKDIPTTADGSFSLLIDLDAGKNTIAVSATLLGASKSMSINVEYRVPLTMNITGIVDNMEVMVPTLPFSVVVSDNAKYSVNGKEGVTSFELATGTNVLAFKAWDAYGATTTRSITVQYKQSRKLVLTLNTPAANVVITEPMIVVAGMSVPNAKVTVNGQMAVVSSSGSFSTRIPIPDEPMEYDVSVVAKLGDDEVSADRTVTYQPVRKPLMLDISSPADGSVIKTRTIRVVGKTSAQTPPVVVKINGRIVNVPASGVISAEFPLSESDIGSYQIDVTADDGTQEISKSFSFTIDIASPQINTSFPSLLLSGIGAYAVKSKTFSVSVLDRTPSDMVTVTMQNNNNKEDITLSPGGRQTYSLDEGINRYILRALDKASNPASMISGTVYYLPGPLKIDLVEPNSSPVTIHDLPPMPRNTQNPRLRLIVDIDDNIGNVPETIKYCRVSGLGVDILMKSESKYRYSTDIELLPGARAFIIKAEDVAGNIATKTVEIDIRR